MGERYRDRGEELMREAGIIHLDSEERVDSGLLIDGYASPAESLADRIRKQGKVCRLTFTHAHIDHQSGETRLFDSMSKEGKKVKGLVYKGDVTDLIYEASETATADEENLLADLQTKVEELEEVNASEDKEAHWIKRRIWMECSRCGNEFSIMDHDYCNLTKYDFCPCCGSWMHEKAAR